MEIGVRTRLRYYCSCRSVDEEVDGKPVVSPQCLYGVDVVFVKLNVPFRDHGDPSISLELCFCVCLVLACPFLMK